MFFHLIFMISFSLPPQTACRLGGGASQAIQGDGPSLRRPNRVRARVREGLRDKEGCVCYSRF